MVKFFIKFRIVVVFILSSHCSYVCALSSITTIGPQRVTDVSHTYFISLLELILTATETSASPTQINLVPYPGQGRTIALMANSDLFDVIWTAESPERNAKIRKIPIPLLKGGLGIRGLVIRSSDASNFSNYNTKQLRSKIACQGMHWPDADILQNSGFNVHRVLHFDAMLEMLSLERCDYLPLSIFEGKAELDIVKSVFPELTFYQGTIIRYPLAMYFYVRKDNPELADRLLMGLQILESKGELMRLMQTHPLTKTAFPLEQYEDSQIINLNSPHNAYSSAEQAYLLPFKH